MIRPSRVRPGEISSPLADAVLARYPAATDAAHTTEVPYVFDNTSGDASQFEEIDRTVSRAMADAWVRFAKTANPNGGGLRQWPACRAPDDFLLDFGDAVTVRSNAHSPAIELFQRVFETMRRKD